MDKMDTKVNKWISDIKKLNLFGRNETQLPYGGSKSSNGVSFSVVNRAVLLSVMFLLFSLSMVGFGIWHCRNQSNNYSFVCDIHECLLTQNKDMPIRLTRKDITGATAVRIDNGVVVDAAQMRSKASRRLGHSVEIRYQFAADPSSRYKVEKKILFSKEDIGAGPSRKITKDLTKFVYKPDEPVNITHGYSFTGVGITISIFGVLFFVLALIFGEWQDVPKRVKKAS